MGGVGVCVCVGGGHTTQKGLSVAINRYQWVRFIFVVFFVCFLLFCYCFLFVCCFVVVVVVVVVVVI